MLLERKIAVITGAASERGIGKAVAALFARHGAKVAIVDLDLESSRGAAADIGDEHIGYSCDVADHSQCAETVHQIVESFGGIDILVNVAGVTQPLKALEIGPDDFDRVTAVNLKGTFNMSQAAIPSMQDRGMGSIICISSVSAQRGGGIFGGAHYSASKAGVLGLARALARELAQWRIRVNCVAPGLIQTDITKGKMTDELKKHIISGIPLGRLGIPLDVAKACLFLASELSEYITGTVINVNGGMQIQ